MVKKSVARALAVRKSIRKHRDIKRPQNTVIVMEVNHNNMAVWSYVRDFIQKYNPELFPEEQQTRNTPET